MYCLYYCIYTPWCSSTGFISGLTAAELPESFIRGKPCRIRPSVQSHYSSLDPYSPLTLVVPKGLSPPWRDCFLEGQKDIVHGGGLTKAVVQNTKLKQCSRCVFVCVHNNYLCITRLEIMGFCFVRVWVDSGMYMYALCQILPLMCVYLLSCCLQWDPSIMYTVAQRVHKSTIVLC